MHPRAEVIAVDLADLRAERLGRGTLLARLDEIGRGW